MKIVRTEDIEEIKALYGAALPPTTWRHDDHEHWLAQDEAGHVAGFCSAVYWPEIDCVFLSAAGVVKDARGAGLQRRLIDVRVRWAQKQGAKFVVTYCALDNYASMMNLFKRGFRGIWLGKWHALYRALGGARPNDLPLPALRRKWFG